MLVIVAVILIAGYIFSSQHLTSRYHLNRTSGWHSYFYVATRGVLFSVISLIVCLIVDYKNYTSDLLIYIDVHLNDIDSMFISLANIKIGMWGLLTILVAYASGVLSKFYYFIFESRKDSKLIKLVSENNLELFILEATFRQFAIVLTLSSRKTYVGLCLGDELTNGELEHIAIIPLLSGYRDKDDLSLNITTNYQKHFDNEDINDEGYGDELTINDFRFIIPKENVESFSFFDLDTYIKFKEIENDKKRNTLNNNAYPDYSIESFNGKPPSL